MTENIIGTIHLDSDNGRVISGREIAQGIRAEYSLDKLEEKEGVIEIYIPEKVEMISSSFILSMFSQSARKLGEKEFYKKYKFYAPRHIMKAIKINVKYSTVTESVLAQNAS